MTGLDELHVVVPVRDEEDLLPRCLDAVAVAALSLSQVPGAPRVTVIAVLDRCGDGSEEVALTRSVETLHCDAGRVGAARRLGVARVQALTAGVSPQRIWVATTDADSAVPEHWLREHVRAAEAGAHVATGPVHPDPHELSTLLLARWHERHGIETVTSVVHGANLGFRLDGYLAVGGFLDLPEHEDVRLVGALLAAGARRDELPAVLTSARREGRTPGGFAGYLRTLAAGEAEVG